MSKINNTNIEKQIFDYLSQHLSPKRFEHSYNVAMLAIDIASNNYANILKAQTAGLLHDCAKYMSDRGLINLLKDHKNFKYFKEISNVSPRLLHSFAGAIIAKEEFGIKDKDTLNAIKHHTLGRANMSVLEKIIFVADSVSLDRKWVHAKRIRNLARTDLDKAFLETLKNKIENVINDGSWLCPQAVNTWNWYVSNYKKNN